MDRAYSLLEVRSVDEEQRIIHGWATTPKVDRMGDVVEPLGIMAAETIPLLLHHDSRLVVGTVRLGKPTKKGVPFTASLPKIVEPGALQDRVNEAWQLVKYGLIAATSIGFRAIEGAVERIDTGLRFLKTEVLELSLVPIPAQDEAVITAFKSYCGGDPSEADLSVIKSFGGESPPEIPANPEGKAASGRKHRVVKLNAPARDRAEPFVIKRIIRPS